MVNGKSVENYELWIMNEGHTLFDYAQSLWPCGRLSPCPTGILFTICLP